MLHQHAIGDAHHVSGDPTSWSSVTRKPAVHDHQIPFGHDGSVFVSQGRRRALDQIEEAFAPWRDMRAVLNVFRRPVPFGGLVVSFVEERIERLKDQRFVCLFDRLWHFLAPVSS
jgi:hypothetical protein